MNLDGIVSCTRYAFMPNRLNYCGPDKNLDLFEYGTRELGDQGLVDILSKFKTLYPYLQFIAHSNKISDIFDKRVVEAYWIGNGLLNNIDFSKFHEHLLTDHNLKKTIKPKVKDILMQKIPLGIKPHHSFHVFHVYKRTGNLEIDHTLQTMDQCRISWGKIKKNLGNGNAIVEYEPLIINNNRITLGTPQEKEVFYNFSYKGFVINPKIGNWVSLHWGWVCEELSERQRKNLEFWTKYHLNLLDDAEKIFL